MTAVSLCGSCEVLTAPLPQGLPASRSQRPGSGCVSSSPPPPPPSPSPARSPKAGGSLGAVLVAPLHHTHSLGDLAIQSQSVQST